MINDSFSLMRGGLVYHALHSLGAIGPGRRTTSWVALLLTAAAMLPIMIATALDGTLYGDAVVMPLLGDYAVLARFLIAVPLLILAAPRADSLLRESIAHFPRSGLVSANNRDRFEHAIDRIVQLRDSKLPETLCLLLALLPLTFEQPSFGVMQGISDWRQTGFAGIWMNVVAVPIFRFIGLIWLWRLGLWCYLLWRLSRIELDLHPAHPDGAAGLGFLAIAQYRFLVLPFAGSVLLAGSVIDHILYLGATLQSLKLLLLSYAIGATLVSIAPLFLMCPKLLVLKRRSILEYSVLGHLGVHAFDRHWLGTGTSTDGTSLLESAQPSALADFGAVFNTVRGMSVVPMTRYNLLWIMLAVLLPLVPVLFVAVPINEILQKLGAILA
ncbi:hypothetical protein IP90_01118 [Luteimonas cucumeris]|uniref:Uncharacterized protein n=1 Tax=Luteimonas cucumeris TaxID=985012 RepID=A0A562LBN4_9GAMM|nr:hypothetical protein [Luteimonas cucumeris]TWI04976.1 hypothetical protein IP90_01118 [Luteimonas cucumeris]